MKNWTIAIAAGSALIGILPTASAQEVQRTGSGAASIACAFGLDNGMYSCLGPGTSQKSFSTPDGSASVSNNVTIAGMSGAAQVTMSEITISISGNASFTPPPSCDEGRIGGQGPTYFANGSQSVYADVPNGTPIRITINASASGTGGGWASWSDAKSGAGGASVATSFNAVAGPGKITVSGVDYYLIDTISASGAAGARLICSAANSQSFSASVSLQFEVLGKTLIKLPGGDGTGTVGSRLDNLLRVRVVDTAADLAVVDEAINFTPMTCPPGYNVNPRVTATGEFGIASALAVLGPDPGTCPIDATCPGCIANKKVTFTAIGELPPDKNLKQGDGGESGSDGPSPTGGSGGSLEIEYGLNSGTFRAVHPPDNGFIGVLTGDNIVFRAIPQSGQLQWSAPGGSSAGPQFSTTFTDEFGLSFPATVILFRSDGKSSSAKVLSVNLPPGPSDEAAKAAVFASLCTSPAAAACVLMGKAWLDAYSWAAATFEPQGRKGSCGNNCCDAGKHMYWHAYVTKNFSKPLAEFLGLAHERDSSPHNEKVMDLTNNHLAQQIGLSNPPNVGDAVHQAIGSGQALVLFDASNYLGLSPLELSTRCGGF